MKPITQTTNGFTISMCGVPDHDGVYTVSIVPGMLVFAMPNGESIRNKETQYHLHGYDNAMFQYLKFVTYAKKELYV